MRDATMKSNEQNSIRSIEFNRCCCSPANWEEAHLAIPSVPSIIISGRAEGKSLELIAGHRKQTVEGDRAYAAG